LEISLAVPVEGVKVGGVGTGGNVGGGVGVKVLLFESGEDAVCSVGKAIVGAEVDHTGALTGALTGVLAAPSS
jgi:hypothetical protein